MVKRDTAAQKRHREIIARTKPNCWLCGEPIDYKLRYPDPKCYVLDHVEPLHKGGADTIENKRAAHHACNSKKRARLIAPIIRRSGALK